MIFAEKKLCIFDLDSTLAESKSPISVSMVHTLNQLLARKKVAVISGGTFSQFEKQFLSAFPAHVHFEQLYLMPVSGSRLYVYMNGEWTLEYAHDFTPEEKQKITDAFSEVFLKLNYEIPEEIYGELIEDRGSQITFSALGQEAPLEKKIVWDPNHKKREEIVQELKKIIPEFNVRIGGSTSIDITPLGVDKATGIDAIQKYLHLTDADVVFVGDALFPGGNDYPAIQTGVECIKVENPADTERLIQSWL